MGSVWCFISVQRLHNREESANDWLLFFVKVVLTVLDWDVLQKFLSGKRLKHNLIIEFDQPANTVFCKYEVF